MWPSTPISAPAAGLAVPCAPRVPPPTRAPPPESQALRLRTLFAAWREGGGWPRHPPRLRGPPRRPPSSPRLAPHGRRPLPRTSFPGASTRSAQIGLDLSPPPPSPTAPSASSFWRRPEKQARTGRSGRRPRPIGRRARRSRLRRGPPLPPRHRRPGRPRRRAHESAVLDPRPQPHSSPKARKRDRLRLALDHLHGTAPAPVPAVSLPPGGALGHPRHRRGGLHPFASPASAPARPAALLDNPDRPMLRFLEDACVQCGLCAATCPERVISLRPPASAFRPPPRARRRSRRRTPPWRPLRQAVRHQGLDRAYRRPTRRPPPVCRRARHRPRPDVRRLPDQGPSSSTRIRWKAGSGRNQGRRTLSLRPCPATGPAPTSRPQARPRPAGS